MASANPFSLDRLDEGGISVLSVRGDVDEAEAREIGQALSDVQGPVVVDVRACTFMGSEGLRALLEGRRSSVERGHRLVVLLHRRGPVARLFDLVAAETFLNLCYDDRDAAIALASASDRRRFPDRRSHTQEPPA